MIVNQSNVIMKKAKTVYTVFLTVPIRKTANSPVSSKYFWVMRIVWMHICRLFCNQIAYFNSIESMLTSNYTIWILIDILFRHSRPRVSWVWWKLQIFDFPKIIRFLQFSSKLCRTFIESNLRNCSKTPYKSYLT